MKFNLGGNPASFDVRASFASALAISIAIMAAAPAQAQDAGQGEEVSQEENPDTIVVTGIRASLEQSIEQKRNASVILDTINAEDIGKLPDDNIAESLQRVTGVQVDRGFDNGVGDNFGAGEGTQVSVRGIRPDLNRTLLNGAPIGSNTDGRNFDFSAISPQLVKRLEVQKSPTASSIEGALGATVNMVTRRPLDRARIQIAVSGQIEVPEFTEDTGYRIAGFISLPLSDTFGVVAGYNRTDVQFQRHRYETAGWSTRDTGISSSSTIINTAAPVTADYGPGTATTSGVGLIPQNLRWNNRIEDIERDNYFAGIQWQPSESLELNIDYLRAEAKNHNFGTQPIIPAEIGSQRLTNVVFEGDAIVSATVSPLVNPANPGGVRYRRMLAIDRDNVTTNDAVTGHLSWDGGAVLAELKGGYSEGSFLQTFNIFNQFWGTDTFTYDFRDGTIPKISITPGGFLFDNPANYTIGVANRSFREFTDKEKFAQIDLTIPVDSGFLQAIKFGARWNEHNHRATRANDVATAGERTGFTLADFILPPQQDTFSVGREGGVISDMVNVDFDALIAALDPFLQDLTGDGNQATGIYGLDESVMAGYVQADFGLGPLTGNIGVRFVQTDQNNTGNAVLPGNIVQPVRFSKSYDDILPSFNLRWEATDNLLVRAALSKTMARPAISDLNLGGNVSPLASTATVNNPDLDPFRADQADLSVEWYFEPQGLLSAGFFYKDIKSFVETQTQQGTVPGFGDQVFTIQTLVNGEGAELKGVELSAQKNFTFLPSPLDGFGVLLNYTYVDAPTSRLDPITGENLPLPGVSKHNGNAILFYEKGGFEARVAYSRRSKYVVFSSAGNYTLDRTTPVADRDPDNTVGLPIFRDAFDQLDANISYRIPGTNITVFAAARNLLNEATYDYAAFGEQELFTSYHKSGRVYTGGVRFRLR